MSQMYKVEIHSVRGPLVEMATYLVVAASSDEAERSALGFAGIPPITADVDVSRVKPSIYELSRRDFIKRPTDEYLKMKEGLEPGMTVRNEEPGAVHEVRVSAKIFGFSESSVLRRLADALIKNSSANKAVQPHHINELSIEIERADERPKPSRVEENAIYKERRMFPGGAARPR